jgi:hypothetical protein
MKAKQQFIPLKRPRFFSGQLLSASDLEAEQRYVLEKQKRHNRGLHGYGVVSGLDVSVKNDDLNIDEGMAIDALGNEIVVPGCVQISLKRTGRVGYVTVRYCEHETDPVPAQSDSNGGVEFSRIEEGFEISITPSPNTKNTTRNEIETGVVLARLVISRGGWRVDRKFRRPKTR